ncbi:hypothetical protein EVB84_021 [Rhizobium phage RHph_Y48]|nr:hypothetical protein EVB84_021 [Rhizobium phage RHph_Y48]QIG70017.1 hypothetical protein EVB85_021 [Rhizobium phage RHph_Y86]QIG70069.1 hypothetical protein EVB86_021 [Rhizobium phage RHph_Y2_7]
MVKTVEGFKIGSLLNYSNYLIGGSYVVSPIHANDIDVLLHEYEHTDTIKHKLWAQNFRTLQQGDEKYDEIDHKRLIEVYEGYIDGVKLNIIVVGATFWPAYEGAVRSMQARPDLYMTREARIELHRSLARQVAAIAQVGLDEGSY